jgi:hypothetical protein
MKVDDAFRTDRLVHRQAALVDPLQDGHVRLGFDLKIALFSVLAVVAPQRPLDVDRVGIVSLDEVRAVAVHRAHEAGERWLDRAGKAAAEPGRLPGEIER